MDLILYSLGISLFDSLSTTFQIVLFVLLLTTERPLRNALVYLAGLSAAYFACGLAGYLALDRLRDFLNRFFPGSTNIPSPLYYRAELLTGLVLAAFGIWYFYRKKDSGPSPRQNWIVSKLKNLNRGVALGLGIFMSVTSFPVSLPYLAVLGKYWALQFSPAQAALYILLYNLGYASPMVLILAIYLPLHRKAEDVHDLLHEKAHRLNVHLTAWTCVALGVFCMADAGCYFVLGRALLKDRFF